VRSKSPFTAVEDSTPRSWCPCIVVLQKSVGRLRAQRSAPSAANGSKARSKQEAGGRGPSHKWNHPARKRRDLKRASAEGHSRRREDGSFERRQSSSRERRISTKAPRSARASARVVAEKLLAMEGISGRRSARLSRGPRGTDLGGLRALAPIVKTIGKQEPRRRRQRCQRWAARSARGRINAARTNRTGHRSEGRAVKRDLPRSHLHRAAPSLSVPGPSSSGEGAARGATLRE